MADTDMQVKVSADITELKTGLDQAKEEVGGFAEAANAATEGIAEGFKTLAEVAGVAFTVDALKEWIVSTAELGEELSRASVKLGVTAQQASELRNMALATGTSFDQMQTQLGRMELQLQKTAQSGGPAQSALKALGINAQEFIKLRADQQIDALAEAFSNFEDGPNKSAAALALLGRAGLEMLPFLDRGKEGLDELRAMSERAGATINNELAAKMLATKEHLNELSLAFSGLTNSMFALVQGPVNDVISGLTKIIEGANSDKQAMLDAATGPLQAWADLKLAIADIKTVMEVVAKYAPTLGQALATAASVALPGWKLLADTIALVKGAGSVLQGDTSAPVQPPPGGVGPPDFSEGWSKGRGSEWPQGVPQDQQTGMFSELGAALRQNAEESARNTAATLDATRQALGIRNSRPNQSDTSNASTSGSPIGKAQVAPIEGKTGGGGASGAGGPDELTALQKSSKDYQTYLDNLLKAHAINEDQWLQQSIATLEQEAQQVKAYYDKQIAEAGDNVEKKKALMLQEQEALAKIAAQEAKDQQKAAQDSAKAWQDMYQSITGSINGQIRGLLQGTTTFAQAMKNIALDIAQHFIQKGEQIVEQWIFGEGQQTAQTATQSAVRVGIKQAEATSSMAPSFAAMIKSIIGSAQETFAGVFGFLSPVMGPAAAGPATAAAGVVSAAAGAVPAADIGMWQVPNDMPALIHRNELVMPAAQSEAFRSMLNERVSNPGGGSSGTTVHFSVSAVDAAGVAAFFRNNGALLAKTVAKHFDANQTLRPQY